MTYFKLCIMVLSIGSTYGESFNNYTISKRGDKMKEAPTRSFYQISDISDKISDKYLTRFLKYAEILKLVNDIMDAYPKLVKMESIGTTAKSHEIFLVRISNNFKDCKKITFVEPSWDNLHKISTSLMLHLIIVVLSEPKLLATTDWHIVPVVEPDSYYENGNEEDPIEVVENKNLYTGPCSDPDSKQLHGLSAVLKVIEKYNNRTDTLISIEGVGGRIMYPKWLKNESLYGSIEMERCALEAQSHRKEFDVTPFQSKPNSSKSLGGLVACLKVNFQIEFGFVVQLPGLQMQDIDLEEWEIKSMLARTAPVIKTLSQCSSRYYKKY